MHFLLTNDDGIHAPGLIALMSAISKMPGARITVVAPNTERSMCGHRVTTNEPIAIQQLDEQRHAVDGTPADCIRVALFALGIAPDFVISGINAGGNMGQDIYISGTAAGAREAAFHGLPAVALSHYLIKGIAVDWQRTCVWAHDVLNELLVQSLNDGEFWNVNFPHHPIGQMPMPERALCHPCRAPLNVAYEVLGSDPGTKLLKYSSTYASRPVEKDSDVALCFGGKIAVTKLRV